MPIATYADSVVIGGGCCVRDIAIHQTVSIPSQPISQICLANCITNVNSIETKTKLQICNAIPRDMSIKFLKIWCISTQLDANGKLNRYGLLYVWARFRRFDITCL
jgi:hypothetical protein